MNKEVVKIILGLKIRQLREEKNLSADELVERSGFSKSYLNEVEKGKKYPQPAKLIALSDALEVSYNDLVSLDLDKKLKPVGSLLRSNILKEMPLGLFGIDERSLIEIIVNAPDKITAFISTLLEMANNYNFSKESFYLAALRSYQEVNDNYFSWIEEKSRDFCKKYNIGIQPDREVLEEILISEFGYTINYTSFEKENRTLTSLRSLFVPESKTLIINDTTLPEQVLFILLKEIGGQFMELNERVNTFTWAKFDTFEQVLNNFYASYFAGAVLIPEKDLVPKLKKFFGEKKWNPELFNRIMSSYGQSPETFYHRLTNLVPEHLGLRSLFFIRLVHEKHSEKYLLDKELHLDEKQSPHAIEMNEHYCRRWVSVKVLQHLENSEDEYFTDCQYSVYPQYNNKRYWVLSTATQDPFKPRNLRSVTIGFASGAISDKIKFADGKEIPTYEVDITCENCPIPNCEVRMRPPLRLEKRMKQLDLVDAVENFSGKFR